VPVGVPPEGVGPGVVRVEPEGRAELGDGPVVIALVQEGHPLPELGGGRIRVDPARCGGPGRSAGEFVQQRLQVGAVVLQDRGQFLEARLPGLIQAGYPLERPLSGKGRVGRGRPAEAG
jgi:hypothetical protein